LFVINLVIGYIDDNQFVVICELPVLLYALFNDVVICYGVCCYL